MTSRPVPEPNDGARIVETAMYDTDTHDKAASCTRSSDCPCPCNSCCYGYCRVAADV